MKTNRPAQPSFDISSAILTVRAEKVLLDGDLARLYGVETKALNRAVRRNLERFPRDFLFQLTHAEFANLKYHFGTSSSGHGGRRKLPWAFTEHGALMAANVLNSPRAVQMSVFVVRAFLKMRELLGGTKELFHFTFKMRLRRAGFWAAGEAQVRRISAAICNERATKPAAQRTSELVSS